MNSLLIRQTAKIFGGSAIAAMGFSFGRDIYKGAKKKKNDIIGAIILIFILAVAVVGTYSSGVWIARNYRDGIEAFFTRLGSLISLSACGAGLFYIGSFLTGRDPTQITQWNLEDYTVTFSMPLLILIIGLSVGFSQRKRRTRVWEAEEANAEFMEKHGLISHEDGTVEDTNAGQNFRIDYMGEKRITLFPLGRRGKRAYITINQNGKYHEYTGMTSMHEAPPSAITTQTNVNSITTTPGLQPVGRSGWSIAAAVLGGISILLFLPAPLAVIASVFAFVDLRKSNQMQKPKKGKALAIFGFCSGSIITLIIVAALASAP